MNRMPFSKLPGAGDARNRYSLRFVLGFGFAVVVLSARFGGPTASDQRRRVRFKGGQVRGTATLR